MTVPNIVKSQGTPFSPAKFTSPRSSFLTSVVIEYRHTRRLRDMSPSPRNAPTCLVALLPEGSVRSRCGSPRTDDLCDGFRQKMNHPWISCRMSWLYQHRYICHRRCLWHYNDSAILRPPLPVLLFSIPKVSAKPHGSAVVSDVTNVC